MTIMEGPRISIHGVERLAREIIRQAVYDWPEPEFQDEVVHFFTSEWGGELAGLFGFYSPQAAVERLQEGTISPKAFHADYGSSEEKSMKKGGASRLL